jgi:hypothetical protein
MMLFTLYRRGGIKTLRATPTIAILWIVILAGSVIVVSPLQKGLGQVIGNSMTTELLYEGFELEFVGELIDALVPVLISKFWLVSIAVILVYLAGVFVTAGIFRVVYSIRRPFRKGLFFMGADRGFTGYLLISLLTGLLVLLISLVLFILPLIIAMAMGAAMPLLKSIALSGVLLVILLLPFLMAAGDYARVNLVADKWEYPLNALKNGFVFVKSNTVQVYLILIPFLVLSLVTSWLAYMAVTSGSNSSSLSLLLLLIAFPLLLFLKSLVNVLRYSTMTALYEAEEGE